MTKISDIAIINALDSAAIIACCRHVVGQDEAISAVSNAVRRSRGLRSRIRCTTREARHTARGTQSPVATPAQRRREQRTAHHHRQLRRRPGIPQLSVRQQVLEKTRGCVKADASSLTCINVSSTYPWHIKDR